MKKKILLVDDITDIAILVKAVLGEQYTVVYASSGQEAFKILESTTPDLILLDIELGDMSGYEICSQLKQDTNLSHIPIIMFSSNQDSKARTTGYNLGAINYLEKPFENSELRSMVSSTLRNSGTSHIITCGNIAIHTTEHKVLVNSNEITLTSKEFKLISSLCHKEGVLFTREQLLNIIGPENLDSSDRIIDNHISSLRKKIKDSNVEIVTIYSQGYKAISNS